MRPRGRSRFRSRAGFTLVELAVAAGVLGLLAASIFAVLEGGISLYASTYTAGDLEMRSWRAAERIAAEVAAAGKATLGTLPLAPASTNTIDYRMSRGFSGGGIVWGAPVRIEVRRDPGELDDGLDNDGDGLVDEGSIVRVRDPGGPGERVTVLLDGVPETDPGERLNGKDDDGDGLVDEGGLSIEASGEMLTVRVVTVRRDGRGRRVSRSAAATVRVRN